MDCCAVLIVQRSVNKRQMNGFYWQTCRLPAKTRFGKLQSAKEHHMEAVSISDTHTIASRLMVSLSDIKYERIISLQFKPVRIFLPARKRWG
jgi:hypothetical protein